MSEGVGEGPENPENPYFLPPEVMGSLGQGASGPAPSYQVDRGECQMVCCQPKIYDGYWNDEWTSVRLEREQAPWKAHEKARDAAWEAERGPWPKSMYGATQRDYWEGYEGWCRTYDAANWKGVC